MVVMRNIWWKVRLFIDNKEFFSNFVKFQRLLYQSTTVHWILVRSNIVFRQDISSLFSYRAFLLINIYY